MQHLTKIKSEVLRLSFAIRMILLSCATVIGVMALGGTAPALAQQDAQGGDSYITPFPKGDVYRVRVVGDLLAQGLLPALAGQMVRDGRLQFHRKAYWFDRVIRQSFDAKLNELVQTLVSEETNIVVVMFGPGDRRSIRVRGKKRWPGDELWRREYSRRIDTVMKRLKQRNIAVYWVGIPVLRKPGANEHAQLMNEVIRERAYINGLKYIDSYMRFLDEQGGYNSWGPDLSGKIRKLRGADGVHLTNVGSRKLAHFIERDLRRDVKMAREERSVPLAGNEQEQARIRQALSRSAARSVAADPTWNTEVSQPDTDANNNSGANRAPSQASAQTQGGYFGGNGGEQKADNSKVEVKRRDARGQMRNLTFEILRPAIPSSVVALVTRKQSTNRAARLGERLIGQIPGGLNVMSTVSPVNATIAGGARQGKLSPAQTPFFRVLVRGERIQPKEGRADDMSWPRPDPSAAIQPAADATVRPRQEPRG